MSDQTENRKTSPATAGAAPGKPEASGERVWGVRMGLTDEPRNETDAGRERVVWGLVLIIGGVLFLMDQLDFVHLPPLWDWWPAVFFAIGIPRLLSRRQWPSGVSMMLLGLTFFAILQSWQGLTWRTGWPLFLMIAGLEIVLKALFVERRPRSAEEGPHA